MKYYNYYYFDELNDDFANNGIDGKPTPTDWQYIPKSKWYRFFKPIIYHISLALFMLGLFFCGVKNKNTKVLKQAKKKGYFIYGNHTGWFMDAVSGPKGAWPRQTYTVVNSDTINIKGLTNLVRFWGAIPTPSTTKGYVNYLRTIKELNEKGKPIVIYPEAHIWPRYNKIRNFSSVSFNYPCKYNSPCFAKTTVYKLKKNGKSIPVVYFDGPVYPDMTLELKEREVKLRDEIRNLMIDRCNREKTALDCRYQYIKVDNKDNVRTEIIEK